MKNFLTKLLTWDALVSLRILVHCLQKREKRQKKGKKKRKNKAENAAKAKGYKTTHRHY
jgi:hypothetical protein